MPFAPGTRLGPYEITAPLGVGGMGEVYKARDTRLDRTVAVKVLPEEIAKREDLVARFEREARAVASLNHPNICSLFDIGDGYMVMELVDGETLADRIGKGALPLEQALKYAAQIADALDRAHRAGVTHRDVKPQNIMVTRDGVKILDFGLAKSASAKPGPTEATLTKVLTAEGTVMGTPQYMAPELFEGREADARADIWAFGAVLYEMVTGRKAFEGKSYSSLVGAILSADPAPMTVQPFTPSWLERLSSRCLAKDPDDRYQSMRDVVLDLRQPPAEDAAPTKPSRWPWAIAAAALVALAGGWMAASRLRQTALESPPVRLSIVPPENGNVTAFTISPDGQSIVFPVLKDGKTRLWTRRLASDDAVAIAGTEGANEGEAATWSPDGQQLAFVAGDILKVVSLQTGKVRDLTQARNRGLAWNADGVILFVDLEQNIRRIPATGGSPEKVKLDLVGAYGSRFPFFLPDQNRFLYVARGRPPVPSSIRVGSLDGKTNKVILTPQLTAPELVTDAGGKEAWLLYTRDAVLSAQRFNLNSLELEGKPVELSDAVGLTVGGTGRAFFSAHSRLVAYRGDESRAQRLVWYDSSGQRQREFGEPQRRNGELRLSPDGRQALVARGNGRDTDAFLETIDLANGTSTRRSFLPHSGNGFWSPDGQTVFFSSRTPANGGVFQSPADWSSAPTRVVNAGIPWDYHPAHQTLLVQFAATGRTRAMKRTPSGWAPTPFVADNEPFAKGKFSPDGQWVAYQAGIPGNGLYLMPYPPTGAKWQVAPDGVEPVWRRDGKELYFIRGADEIMAVSIDASGRTIRSGTPRSLFRAALPPATIPSHRYDVAPDGKLLVMERVPDPPGVPFSVLLNWRSLAVPH